MQFIRLGITNVRRNIGRSLLSMVSMALAAMILSTALPVAEGYPGMAYKVHRQFVGGDIIIYPGRFRPDRYQMADAEWTFTRLPKDLVSDLISFHPEYYTNGFLSQEREANFYVNLQDILSAQLARKSYVDGVSLNQSIPAFITWTAQDGSEKAWFSPLRARDPVSDLDRDFDELITAGRAFIRCDDGKFHALLDNRRTVLPGYEQVAVGSTINVDVPSATLDRHGNYVFDYTNMRSFEFKIVGRYALHTRSLMWQDEMGNYFTEDLYWTTPQVLVPQTTLTLIWQQVSGGLPLPVTEVAVRVKNMAFLENNTADIAQMLPDYTVVSVPYQVKDAESRGLPEPVLRYPGELARPEDIRQTGTPMDLRNVMVAITYSIAALLVASNMLIALSQRRREIGILKAIGARSREIMLMVMAEVMFVSVVGAAGGFILLRSVSLWTYLSNRMPVLEIGVLTISDFTRVIVMTLGFALVFGVVPALNTLRMSPMEVLRNE